jgi:2-dehydropantoate 2-reductase
MKICVFGAGAIGGHAAARLSRGGADVSVIARGPQLDAIRARGLCVEAPDASFDAAVRAAEHPAELGPQDAVLVTVKAPALPSVAQGIAPLLGPDTAVAFVMNGIPWWYAGESSLSRLDPGDAVRRAVGLPRTLGGVVWSACTVVEPGVVRVESESSRIVLGRPDGGASPVSERIAAHLEAGGMGGKVVPDIRRELWVKLLNNLTNGPICLLSRADMRTTFGEPALREAALGILREGLAIAAAEGHALEEGAEARILRSITLAHKPSILQDVEAGRPTEFAALFEAALDIGRARGVHSPMLETMVALARVATRPA